MLGKVIDSVHQSIEVDDFKFLSDLGLFNAQHLNHAIYQFKRFESASLDYALTEGERERRHLHEQIGLWDTVTSGAAED